MDSHAGKNRRVAKDCASCPTRGACLAGHAEDGQLQALASYFETLDAVSVGEYLYRAGDQAGAQFHVRSGMFKTYAITADGDEFVTGFHLPGAVLGLARSDDRHVESAVALDTSSACRFTPQQLARLADIDLAGALLTRVSAQDTQRLLHHANLRQSSAQARFAGFCCLYADVLRALGRCATELPLPMSRTDIASYLGMSLESLSRVMAKLNKAGIVATQRSRISLLQPEELATLASHQL